jgi:hypothetical protein
VRLEALDVAMGTTQALERTEPGAPDVGSSRVQDAYGAGPEGQSDAEFESSTERTILVPCMHGFPRASSF